MVSDCCSKRCHERGLVIACWFVVAVWDRSPRSCLLRGWALLVWVWALFGIGDGWPGVGSCGVARGWGWLVAYNGRAGCLRRAAQSTPVGGLPSVRYLKVSSLETSSFLGILVIEMCFILSWHIEWTVDVTIARCWPVG